MRLAHLVFQPPLDGTIWIINIKTKISFDALSFRFHNKNQKSNMKLLVIFATLAMAQDGAENSATVAVSKSHVSNDFYYFDEMLKIDFRITI